MKAMKKRIVAVLLILTLVLSTGCSGKKESGEEPSVQDPKETTADVQNEGQTEAPVPVQKECGISELYSAEGTGEDMYGTEYEYSYHVPRIDLQTPGAASVNEKISNVYGEMTRACLEMIEKKEEPQVVTIGYESYRSGGVLSILLKTVYYYGYFEIYDVLNYDVEADRMHEIKRKRPIASGKISITKA